MGLALFQKMRDRTWAISKFFKSIEARFSQGFLLNANKSVATSTKPCPPALASMSQSVHDATCPLSLS